MHIWIKHIRENRHFSVSLNGRGTVCLRTEKKFRNILFIFYVVFFRLKMCKNKYHSKINSNRLSKKLHNFLFKPKFNRQFIWFKNKEKNYNCVKKKEIVNAIIKALKIISYLICEFLRNKMRFYFKNTKNELIL